MSAAETTQVEYELKVTDGPSTESGTETHVLQFDIVEGISELFQVELLIAYADVELDLRGLMGKEALLTLVHEEGDRHFHGIVAEAHELEETANFTRYKLRIVPRLWLLKHQRESRIFQEKTTPEILAEVFEAAGITGDALDDRTNSDFEARNYCVQYRESSLNFAKRLMEEDGICFWFEHSDDNHTLVIADDNADFVSVGSPADIPFQPPGSGTVGEQHVWRYRSQEKVRPGKATLIDYSFKQPTQDMEAAHEGDLDTDLEIYDFPGGYVASSLGTKLAQIRHEELQVRRTTGRGSSTVTRLMAGRLFELKEHPNNNLNVEYLLLRVHHKGQRTDPGATGADNQSEYSNEFEVMPSEVVYRPARRTPVPQISGLQTAIVTGPSGEEIYVDEFGRVKVQFHWDRQGGGDDASSCWIRVSQGWAGTGFGQVYLPRIGQEVIVQFIEGDPDRPLITGRVYNGDNALPYPLPDNKTVSTTKSNSSKDDDGFNELRFEDKVGSEEIYLHAQKDFNERVLSCHTTDVGYDQTNTVHNNQTEVVDVDQKMSVGGTRTVEVTGKFTETIDGGSEETINAGRTQTVNAGQTQTINEGSTQNINGGSTQTIVGGSTQTITGNDTRTVNGNYTETINGNLTETITGNVTSTRMANVTNLTLAQEFTVNLAPRTHIHAAPVTNCHASPDSCFEPHSIKVIGLKASLIGVSMSVALVSMSRNIVQIKAEGFEAVDYGILIKKAGVAIQNEKMKVQSNIIDTSSAQMKLQL